jgi:hypothetical protein
VDAGIEENVTPLEAPCSNNEQRGAAQAMYYPWVRRTGLGGFDVTIHRPVYHDSCRAGLLATLAALLHAADASYPQMFLGPVKFFTFDVIGAIIWGVMTALYVWLFRALWTMDLRGWLFVIVLAGLNLIMDGLSVLGASTLTAMLPSLIVNALILIYALSPGVKEAYDWRAAFIIAAPGWRGGGVMRSLDGDEANELTSF